MTTEERRLGSRRQCGTSSSLLKDEEELTFVAVICRRHEHELTLPLPQSYGWASDCDEVQCLGTLEQPRLK